MSYPYGPPPGAFGMQQPSYGPPGGANPPGMSMGPPPKYGAPPGMQAPPGMAAQSPVGVQTQFQAPPNLPNINFNAPVIRLGVDGQRPGPSQADRGDRGGRGEGRGSNSEPLGNRNRAGLGAGDGGQSRNLERERQQVRENMMAMQPPTREEVARTIFVGGLGDGAPSDDMLESLLRCAGKLRRWTRVRDANDKKRKYGFAEYEDVESLEAANEIYQDVEVPLFDHTGALKKEDGSEAEVKMMKLQVVVDEQSLKYIEEWKGRRKEDDTARQFRIDGCKEDLRHNLASLINASSFLANGSNGQHNGIDGDGDTKMGELNGESKDEGAEIVNIPLELDDELGDIPAEMRATVAEEIKAFRDRSNRRDLDRARKEEEAGYGDGRRINRLASPPPSSAPSGPASAANGVPVGPRGHVPGAPSGPKGLRGIQAPNEYASGMAFVPAAGPDWKGVSVSLHPEDEYASASDEELESRRQKKQKAEGEQKYKEIVARWETRERQRDKARQREKDRGQADKAKRDRVQERETLRMAGWNDEEEARLKQEAYYYDRSSWQRDRVGDRDNETKADNNDRELEDHEHADDRRRAAEARGQANSFLDQLGNEMEAAKAAEHANTGFGGFKLSTAAKKSSSGAAPAAAKRNAVDVEGLLEDEEDAAASRQKRPELKPLEDTSTVPLSGQDLTPEEKEAARKSLAQEIPVDAADLFAFPIKWTSLPANIIDVEIRKFVERKVLDYLGVQEDLLVDTVLDAVHAHKRPEEIIGELEPALEDEAENLMKKVWRMLIYWSESESRGLS